MIKGREKLERQRFLICPIRGATETEQEFLENYVDLLEEQGIGIHYPLWDTKQDGDPIGLRICFDNKEAIKNAGQVDIYCNERSEGSMFDLGMTFMARKKLNIVNPDFDLEKLPSDLKDLLINYSLGKLNKSERYERMVFRRELIKLKTHIQYQYWGRTPQFLFDFGMSFMNDLPIGLLNKNDVIRTPHKSFENVLLALDEKYACGIAGL